MERRCIQYDGRHERKYYATSSLTILRLNDRSNLGNERSTYIYDTRDHKGIGLTYSKNKIWSKPALGYERESAENPITTKVLPTIARENYIQRRQRTVMLQKKTMLILLKLDKKLIRKIKFTNLNSARNRCFDRIKYQISKFTSNIDKVVKVKITLLFILSLLLL